jgi:hypothetical protein
MSGKDKQSIYKVDPVAEMPHLVDQQGFAQDSDMHNISEGCA